MSLAEVTQGLNHQSTYSTGRRHVSWRSLLEHNVQFAESNAFAPAVRQKDDFCRDLVGQPQQIGGIRTGRLQASSGFAGQCFGNLVYAWGGRSHDGMLSGHV